MTYLKKLLSFLGFWSFHLLLLVLIPFFIFSCFATNLYTCVVQAFRWTEWDIGRMWDIFVDSFQRGVK